jgi:hypothetical protein
MLRRASLSIARRRRSAPCRVPRRDVSSFDVWTLVGAKNLLKMGSNGPFKICLSYEIAALNFAGWPIPDDYLTEIGRIAVIWATLEDFLNICLGKLAGYDQPLDYRPFILVTHTSFPQRLDSFAALCEQLLSEHPQLVGYKRVVSEIKDAQAIRNKFMHHGLSLNPDTGLIEMAVGSARGVLKTKTEVISITDIKRACVQINDATRALYKLVLHRDIPPPWSQGRE